MSATLPALRGQADLIALGVRICNIANVMDMNGHVSMRDPQDANVMWINSRKASRSTLTASDVVAVDLVSGQPLGNGDEPPSEFHIHREIYKRRPDVNAIVHSHPKRILSLSIAGVAIKPCCTMGTFLPATGAPIHAEGYLVNSVERGAALAETLGSAPLVVMRAHGTVAVGANVEEAVIRMFCAEENAEQQFAALQVGTPRYLEGEELATHARENFVPKIVHKFWHYFEESGRRSGALDGLTQG
jgi:L-fuculose-phosphate aldolase